MRAVPTPRMAFLKPRAEIFKVEPDLMLLTRRTRSQLQRENAATAGAHGSGRTNAKRGIVLLIEDEAGLRRLLRFCLERDGYQVVEAVTGEEGIDAREAGANPMRCSWT